MAIDIIIKNNKYLDKKIKNEIYWKHQKQKNEVETMEETNAKTLEILERERERERAVI